MTTKVTKESLAENIGRLESYGDLSLNEEYQLSAYRMLIELMPEDKHEHNWLEVRELGKEKSWHLCDCGATRAPDEDDQHMHMVD